MMNRHGKISDRECQEQLDNFAQTLTDGLSKYKDLENKFVLLQINGWFSLDLLS